MWSSGPPRAQGSWAKVLLLAVTGVGFWTAVFGIAHRVLRYIRDVPDLGTLLAGKVLSVILLAFLSILLLSNIITALSTFFLARDLDLLVGAPIGWLRLYLAKLAETIVHSSWMVALLALPILTAYGMVFQGGPLFPFVALAAIVPYLVMPAVAGTIFTVLLVNVFPARRTRELLGLIGLGGVAVLVLVFRFIRPEQLARPGGVPELPGLPQGAEGAHQSLASERVVRRDADELAHARGRPVAHRQAVDRGAVCLAVGALVHRQLFLLGYSKAQEGAARKVRRPLRGPAARFLGWLPPQKREFLFKDMRLFFRDNTQWSQLILLVVLVAIYIFNIKSLPIHTGERIPFALVTVISFLNLGLAGFVLSAVAARFIFPGISLEGRQMWLLRSSPLDPRSMLWSKYWMGTVPLLLLAVGITALTNGLLEVSPFMMATSLLTIVLYTMAVSALALTFGVFYPQFATENAAQIPTSFGGVVYMMSSLCLLAVIIMIEALPVAAQLRAWQKGQRVEATPELLIAGAAVAAICIVATLVPLRLSARRLELMEW